MKPTIRLAILPVAIGSLCALWTLVSAPGSLSIMPAAVAGTSGTSAQSTSGQPHLKSCSAKTMQGTHGYSYSGTVLGNPIAAAGPITFDGEGNLSATYTVSLAGVTHQGTFTGTYVVNPDCTGAVTLSLPLLGLSTSGTFVIINDAQETFFVGTDSGITVNGTTKRQ